MSRYPADEPHPSETSTFVRAFVQLDENTTHYLCHACGANMYRTFWDSFLQKQEHYAEGVYLSRDGHVAICTTCADAIANLYNKAHGGAFLTWPNPPQPPNPRDKWKIRPGLRRDVYERDLYRCRYCGAGRDLGVDHVIPITDERCTNDLANLVTCCRSCNSSKGSRTPEAAGMELRPEPEQEAV